MISYVPTMLQDFEVKQEVLKKKKKVQGRNKNRTNDQSKVKPKTLPGRIRLL